MNIVDKIIKGFLFFSVVFIIFGVVMFVFTKQTETINEEVGCDKLRECIIIKHLCIETTVSNNFLGTEWEEESVLSTSEQKEYYIKNCFEDVLTAI